MCIFTYANVVLEFDDVMNCLIAMPLYQQPIAAVMPATHSSSYDGSSP